MTDPTHLEFNDKTRNTQHQMTDAISNRKPPVDRFQNLSNNYGDLFSEVFAEQGMNYAQLERSVLTAVEAAEPDFRSVPILDIGIGDGETTIPFVEAGYSNLTGIDLNPHMITAARARFGDSVRLFEMNATDMSAFHPGDFGIIIAGAAIHNIPTKERQKFWQELVRLNPRTFVFAEKIKDADPAKHQTDYDREVAAIKKVYGERRGLHKEEKEWLDHYEYDESIALTLEEIRENLGRDYDISVVAEMGLYKTVLAKKKEQSVK